MASILPQRLTSKSSLRWYLLRLLLCYGYTCVCITSIITQVSVDAIPVFNSINSVDVAGHTCPRLTARNQPCPLLCVRDPSRDCPESIRPSCPPNKLFCGDGTCQRSCRGIVNVCACGTSSSSSSYRPCQANQLTNIPLLDKRTQYNQTVTACAADLQLDLTQIGRATGDVLTDNSPTHAWLQCPARAPPQFSYTEPTFLVIYIYIGLLVCLLTGWHWYKRFYETRTVSVQANSKNEKLKPHHQYRKSVASPLDMMTRKGTNNTSELSSSLSSAPSSSSILSDSEMDGSFLGYRRSIYGHLVYGMVHLTTLLFFILLAVIVVDYYGLVTGVSYGVLLTSDLSSAMFITLWHILAVWLVLLNLLHARLRNYFRLATPLSQAHYVQVTKYQPVVTMLKDEQFQSSFKWLNNVIRVVQRVEQVFSRWIGQHTLVQTVPMQTTRHNVKYFEFQCTRYVSSSATSNQFAPYHYPLGGTYGELQSHRNGLSNDEATRIRDLVGSNFIKVSVPSFLLALLEEFRAFFYIYQVMCLWVWYYFAYATVAIVQMVVILVSALVKVIIRIHSARKIKQLAEHRDICRVYRGEQWLDDVSTTDLVPGDVIDISSMIHHRVPCDAVLLTGEVMVDESALTGEPIPIRKSSIATEEGDTPFKPYDSSKLVTLFAGTTILQTTAQHNDARRGTTALVIAIGTGTDKGQLIRKILFPSPVSFIFNEHLRLVFATLLVWGIICFALTMWLMGRGNLGSWFYGLFAISYVISPLLPASLVVGQSVAAARLRHKQIYCVDLPRVIMAGKVQVFCFDKTGTLTEEGLDYYGMHIANKNGKNDNNDLDYHYESSIEQLSRLSQMALALCHSVTTVDDRLVGNPVDVEQFRVTGWRNTATATSTESTTDSSSDYLFTPPDTFPTTGSTPISIVKRYEFVRARASMSVIIRDPLNDHLHVFVKGSFERVRNICQPHTLPHDIDELVARYAAEGCYVLALAHRDMGPVSSLDEDDMVAHLNQEDTESDCKFLGLLLFKNQLKPDTTNAIAKLKSGDTRTVMITGDHALTGIYIARQCGILPKQTRVLLGDISNDMVQWYDPTTHESIMNDVIRTVLSAKSNNGDNDGTPYVELAVTGKAFVHLCRTGEIRDLLPYTRIFARMTPDDKVQCVQLFMERAITAMCGDGGNDCGALRAAHCGLALGSADASIVSPFSTRRQSIECCVELLRQGRAALATSFTNYKFLITYGEIMVFRGLTQAYFSVVMSQWIYIFIDSIIIIALSFALTQSKPARTLASQRPTSRLFGVQTLASVLGQVLMNVAFLAGAFGLLFRQSWYRCREFDGTIVDNTKWWVMGDNYEAQMIACVSFFQFLSAAFVYNFGYKFRQTWWRNWRLMGLWLAVYTLVSYIILADPNRVGCLFRMNCGDPDVLVSMGYPRPSWSIESYNSALGHNVLPVRFRWTIWGLAQANLVIAIIYERFIVLGPVRRWWLKRQQQQQQHRSIESRIKWTP